MPMPESYSVIIVPSDHSGTRQYRVSHRLVVASAALLSLIAVVLLVFAVTYSLVLKRASEADELKLENEELRVEVAAIQRLGREIETLTSMRAQVLKMLGSDGHIADDAQIRDEEFGAESGSELLQDTERVRQLFADVAREAFAPRGWPSTGKVRREYFAQHEGDEPAHPGLDLAVDPDAPVLAAGRGQVIESGHEEGRGHFVVIDHGYGFRTAYAGLGRLIVAPGISVEKGSPLGILPRPGESDGIRTGTNRAPVLYFEIRVDGTPVDPRTYLSPR